MVGNPDGSGSIIKVTVLRCRSGEVRLGFESPDRLTVHRLEVWDRIRADAQEERPSNSPLRKKHPTRFRRDVHGDLASCRFDSAKGN